MNKNLVVVRAGDRSLHPQWIGDNRNWDLAVSYYGEYPDRYYKQYDYLHLCKGSKWQGLNDFILTQNAIIAKYDYVWFPDDDLLCECQVINQFFKICSILDLTLAQPALTEYSYFSWSITLRKSGLAARLTDFVEIMAPCFKVELFDKFKATFSENSSGHGLEWLWKKIAIENHIFKFGIIDMTPIYHTRKVGSVGHGGSIGSTQEEMRRLLMKYNIKPTIPVEMQRIGIGRGRE